MQAAVVLRLGLPSAGDPRVTTAVIQGHINEALRKVSTERDWPWLLTSASLTLTTGTAATPARFMSARRLVIGGRRARFVPLDEWLDTTRETPVWTIIGTNVQLAPTPTAALTGTLYYYAAEADLASGSASPTMPAHLHDVIVHYATHLGALARQDDAKAADNLSLYDAAVKKMSKDFAVSPKARRVRMRTENAEFWASWS